MSNNIGLQPSLGDNRLLASHLETQFRRIQDKLSLLGRIEQTTVEVTGSVTIDTGIPITKNVVVSLAQTPAAGAAYVTATLDPDNSRQVIIKVWRNTFAAATIPALVNMIAVGDEPPYRTA